MRARSLLALSAALALTAFAPMGGWATITMDPYSTRIAPSDSLRLAFVVKQHGVRPLAGLVPRIEAVAEGHRTVTVKAKPVKGDGRYSATVRLPSAGDWTVTVHSGFMTSKLVLTPVHVLGASEVAQAAPKH